MPLIVSGCHRPNGKTCLRHVTAGLSREVTDTIFRCLAEKPAARRKTFNETLNVNAAPATAMRRLKHETAALMQIQNEKSRSQGYGIIEYRYLMDKLTPSSQAVLATHRRDQRRPTCRMAAVKRYRLAIQADGGITQDDTVCVQLRVVLKTYL